MFLDDNVKFKLILGLGNQDIKSALDMALLYAHAGVRFFDIAPGVLPDLKRCLVKAGYNVDEFTLCVSVATLGDIHGRKAHISESVCSGCAICLKNCPQFAISKNKKTGKCEVDNKKCIGCGFCKKAMNCYAISFEYGNSGIVSLNSLVDADVIPDMVELHASVSDKKQIIRDFKDILSVFKGDISVCVNKKQFSLNNVIDLLKELRGLYEISNPKGRFFVQADGASMNGGAKDAKSTLECILFAKELIPYGFNLIISGGTNVKTPKMLYETIEDEILNGAKMPIIGYGTYARNLINGTNTNEAIIMAEELLRGTEKYSKV